MNTLQSYSLSAMSGAVFGYGFILFGQGDFNKGLALVLIGFGMGVVLSILQKLGYPVQKSK